MQRNKNSIMIFEIIRGGGGELTGWGRKGPAYFLPWERMGRPILSPGKKLTGGKFRNSQFFPQSVFSPGKELTSQFFSPGKRFD